MNLLFAGRHPLHTKFQEKYLDGILQRQMQDLPFLDKEAPKDETLDELVIAITSNNHEGSRFNPIDYEHRLRDADRFAKHLRDRYRIKVRIIGIPHFPPTAKFVDYMFKEIENKTHGSLVLTPQNTIVLSSTPALIGQYNRRGFSILPAELGMDKKYRPETPIELLKKVVEAGDAYEKNPKIREELRRKLSTTTLSLWDDSPEILQRARRIYTDPLLTEQGDLTKSRQYPTYAFGMGNTDIMRVKYFDIKPFIKPGKIVDEGCADGSLLTSIARNFPDSDLMGVEATGEFIARARERQRVGDFGGSYVYFHQRNIMQPIFKPDSIDTTICNSTGHELWSYGDKRRTIDDYLKEKYKQTKNGGVLVMRDVIGPENKEQEVYMLCNESDGSNENIHKQFKRQKSLEKHLNGLSTYARFLRFAEDYLAEIRASGKRVPETKIKYTEITKDDKRYIKLRLKDAVEFMTHKDYTANWQSEMIEEFAFWSFSEWKQAMASAGFKVKEDTYNPKKGSRAYRSKWITDNRFKGKVELYEMNTGRLRKMPYPVTNMVMVGEK